jgi:alkylhydroperoxidase family enzyme
MKGYRMDISERRLPFINPPRRIPLLLRVLLGLVERRLGGRLMANRILAWYPKALLGSGIMEALVAHEEPDTPRRLLTLVRIYTSFLVSCPFCIDLNSKEYKGRGIGDEEIRALRGLVPLESVSTFTRKEKAALRYVECICKTPLSFTEDVVGEMGECFSERGMVIVASTSAQVNFWARLIQALGVLPAGFSGTCPVLGLEEYATLKTAAGQVKEIWAEDRT